jgi:pimeloyl-ACP methyl ester carboxylesterase
VIKKFIYFLAFIILIGLGGAGWYFSGLIYSVGLNPEFTDSGNVGTAEDRVKIHSINSSTITFNIEEEQWGYLYENGLYGIIGQNGEAVAGKILSINENLVTRELIQINGTLVEGDLIRDTALIVKNEDTNKYKILGSSSWSGQVSEGVYTPKSVADLYFKTVTYTSELGDFPAYLTDDGDKGIVIFVHGFRGDYKREVFAMVRSAEFAENGYRSMIISYRNDRGLPQDPSGIFQYGVTEWKDLDSAIEKARTLTDNIVLFCISGGGGPCSSWLGSAENQNQVSGVIYEAPVISFWESVEINGESRFPWVPSSLFSYFKIFTEIRYGVDFDSMDFRYDLIESQIPALLFHGDDDEWVPVSMSDFIASNRDYKYTYKRYENVGHVTAWNADPEDYQTTIKEFLNSLD